MFQHSPTSTEAVDGRIILVRTAVGLSPDEAGGGAESRPRDLQSPRLRHSGVRGVPALMRTRLQRPLVTIAMHVRQPYGTDTRAVVRLMERLRMGNNMEFDWFN